MAEAMVETGVSFIAVNSEGDRWHSHKVAIDLDYLRVRLDGEARERFDALPVVKQILAARVLTEILICLFRKTRKDPDYSASEIETWRKVFRGLVGEEGIENVGI